MHGTVWTTVHHGHKVSGIRSQELSHLMQSTLKRARTNSLPELPRIKGELILQVFTHHTLRRGPDSEDNARLCALGSSVLDASVAIALFQMRPMEDVESMNVCANLSKTFLLVLISNHRNSAKRSFPSQISRIGWPRTVCEKRSDATQRPCSH